MIYEWVSDNTSDHHPQCECASCPVRETNGENRECIATVEDLLRNYQASREILTGAEIARLIEFMKRTGRLER